LFGEIMLVVSVGKKFPVVVFTGEKAMKLTVVV
jgi:hypothetical protein